MMIKKTAVFLCFVPLLLLCGCGGYREIDMQYMISALGFDFNKEYIIYAETVSIGTDSNTAAPRVFKGEGNSLDAAFEDLQKGFSKTAQLGHCAAIILSTKLNKEQCNSVLSFCISKRSVNLSACTAKCGDIPALLSAESETAAVGYDIYAIQKKQKSISGSELYKFLSGDIKSPFFYNKDGGAAQGGNKNEK